MQPQAKAVKLSCVVGICLFLFSGVAAWRAQDRPQVIRKPPDRSSWSGQPKYRSDEILVRFRAHVPAADINHLHAAIGTQIAKSWRSVEGLQLLRLPRGMRVKDALRAYQSNPNVLYAEPDYIVHSFDTPNDPQFPQLWALQNTGQLGGTPGADIHATQAWNLTAGTSGVAVAVIDTGIDYNHSDLMANTWNSPSVFTETVDGTDVDCPAGTHGFNAVSNSCDPMDDNGHGTHVSGTIGAAGNNAVGVTGVDWSVEIIPCKSLDSAGTGTTDAALTCLDFVKAMKDRGVNIVATNNSWGSAEFSQSLFDAIQAQLQDGILFIAAAGNEGTDADLDPDYPAGFFLPNVISVAATTRFDSLANFSNFGMHSVSIAAPGQEILSTFPGNSYEWLSGTSMATPQATGVAALLAAQDPARDWRAIRNLLLSGGDTVAAASQTISGKRLNAYGSITCSNVSVERRLQPSLDTIVGNTGTAITLAELNINCGQPAGPVTVTVSPGNQTITLADNGVAPDQAAQDGIYTGQWTPGGFGNYQLTFPSGDTVQITALNNYVGGETDYSYQSITGTNLNLGDDDVAAINLPFPVQYGGAAFSRLYVSSNGTISFTNAFSDFLNSSIPVNFIENLNSQNSPPAELLQPVVTLVAPLWMDLFPMKGSAQNVFWEVTGSAPNRQVVVEWRNVRSFACRSDSNANVTFEAVISESTSNVLFNYSNADFGDACADQDDGQVASIGVQTSQNSGAQWGGFSVSEYPGGQYGVSEPTVSSGMSVEWTLVDPNTPPNPLPTVTSISPTSLPAGSGDTWVTLSGTGFVPASQAEVYPLWARVTKYVSPTQVQVLVMASDLTYPSLGGNLQLNVVNPAPGGGTSQPVYLSVTGQNPVITSLSPSSVPAGSFGFNVTVTGAGFVPGTDFIFNGTVGQTTFVSPTEIVFPVTGAQVQAAGTVNVQLQTGPNAFSNVVLFTITASGSPATIEAPTLPTTAPKSESSGTLTPEPLPGRFLGWKAAKLLGDGYAASFRRSLARLAPPLRAAVTRQPHAVANVTASSVAPAGFNFRPTLPAGFIPTAVITGDFNGDGKLDWVVANGGDNTIWIYLGRGDGTAQLPSIVHLRGYAPVALAAADMNGDGKLDLIVAEADSPAVAVLFGNGDGTFGPELTFTVPSYPESLAVADFNGDGKLDVVVGMLGFYSTGQLAFLPGDGTGKLGTPIIHYGQINDAVFTTFSIVAADLNGDGLPDIVALDYSISMNGVGVQNQMGNAGARVYLNEGNGTFKMAQQFFHDLSVDQVAGLGEAATAVALGDVNGDGCTDAVTVDTTGTATFFPGKCDGTFDTGYTRTSGAGIAAAAAALADVNGDGHLDLVASSMIFANDAMYQSTPSGSMTVQFGDGAGNFGAPILYRGEPEMVSLAVADLKHNGRPDIITANQNTDTATVFQNGGSGTFGAPTGGYVGYLANGQMHAVGNAPLSNFAVVDMNGDGLPDLATVEVGSEYPLPAQIATMLNNGSGGFSPPIRAPILDVNNDVDDFFLGDFRNAGRNDLLIFTTSGSAPSYGFAVSNGDGTFQKPMFAGFPSSVAPVTFAVGDFNSDGKLDFLVLSHGPAFSGTGTIASIIPFLGNGDGTFSQGTPVVFNSTASQQPYIGEAVVTDVNGDGKADLLLLGSQLLSPFDQNAIYEFLANGDGTFQAPKLLFNNLGPFTASDLNSDGHPDIVAAINQGQTPGIFGFLWSYQVLIGNGDGTFTSGQTYGPFPNPYGVAGYLEPPANEPLGVPRPIIGDFNGDGKPDIAVYQTGGSNVFNEIGYAGAPLDTTVSILTGNGDGTFDVPTIGERLGSLVVPQTAADLNGDGRTDLLEMNGYTSAFTYLTATSASSFTVGLVSDPVIGTAGKLRISLTNASTSATTVQVSASDPNITIAPSATVPAGAMSGDVSFQIGSGFNPSRVFALTAQVGTESHTAYGTQAAPGQATGFTGAFQNTAVPVILPGQTTPDYGLIVQSIGGYTTEVTIACDGLPAGASCQIAPNPATLPAGGDIAASLTVASPSSIAPAQYSFQVTVTDGTVSTTIPAAFNVGDFAMTLSPTAQTLGPNDFTSFTLNIQGINGYSRPIDITCSGLPAGTPCPFSGPVPPGPDYFQLHTNNAALGTYAFTLTGASQGVTHTVSGQLTITNGTFTGTVSPGSATIDVGTSHSFSVQVNSTGGFQGQVNLACNSVTQLTCTLAPTQVNLNSGGSATAQLIITVTASPAALPLGPYRSPREPRPRAFVLLLLCSLLAWSSVQYAVRLRKEGHRPGWISRTAMATLVIVAFGLCSCGGGGGSPGGQSGGGNGGGTTGTVTTVTVQGSAGSTTVQLGVVTVTVP